jgi:hypothetical protein
MSIRDHLRQTGSPISHALTTEKGERKSVPAHELRPFVSRQKLWIPMPFGKHEGLTLPQILFTDPDYFFWLKGVLKGALASEINELAQKARRIRIPREPAEAFMIEYRFEREGQFVRFSIVQRDKERYPESHIIHRATHLDFSYLRNRKQYDKRGYVRFLRGLRKEFFGNKSARVTKDRCEGFFDDDNFLTDDEYRRNIEASRRGL